MIRKRIAILLTVALVFSLTATSTFARSKSEVKKDINTTQEQLDKGKEKSESLNNEMKEVETKIKAGEAQVNAVSAEVAKLQAQIADAQKKLAAKQKEVEESTRDLNVRLRNMYKNGSIGFVDVVLSSEGVEDLVSNLEMVKRIYSSDKDMVTKLQKEHDEIAALEKDLEVAKSDQEAKLAELETAQNELEANYKTLSASKKAVDANNKALEADLHDLQLEAGVISSGTSTYGEYTGSSSGQFMWPVNGRVSSEYAYRNCPYHGWELHNGLDISAPTGTAVKAADDGKVIFAGWQGGYGNVVIISHGNGLYTLYGHNSSLTCSAGQTVSKGTQIARVGATGNATGPHCHFEVRVGSNNGGAAVNPRGYL